MYQSNSINSFVMLFLEYRSTLLRGMRGEAFFQLLKCSIIFDSICRGSLPSASSPAPEERNNAAASPSAGPVPKMGRPVARYSNNLPGMYPSASLYPVKISKSKDDFPYI